ncbi:MAG: PASTA domain-containing protein, partial [Microbacterium sp.]
RAAKGGWLIAIVLLLALLAGGTGWWFGSGPGSLVGIPSVAGLTFDDASNAITAAGLTPEYGEEYSVEVATGLVIRTEPGDGERVDKAAAVRVVVSLGPAPHDVAALGGMTLAEATAALQAASVTVGDTQHEFTTTDSGTVIAASVTPQGSSTPVDCTSGCTVHEGDSAALTVSDGPLPDVTGMSVTDATTALTAVGVQVSSTQEYSDTVDAGDVIGVVARDGGGNWRPGDTVTLRVSKGPELFDVPDVVGQTRDAAKQTLEAAGFEVTYNSSWDLFPDSVTEVTAQNPTAGEQKAKGTTITLSISGSF